MSKGQPRILFLTLSDDVGSERIVSEMGRRGALCAVLGRVDAVAAKSRHLFRHHVLPSRGGLWAAALGVARHLEMLVAGWRPDAVVPLDDMAASVLRDIAIGPRTGAGLRAVLKCSLGNPIHYRTTCCRAALIETAASIGLRTPAQRSVRDLKAAEAAAGEIGYPLMLKREATCGGSGVVLVRDAAALADIFRSATRKAQAKRAVRRLFGFRLTGDGAAITLQAHVIGTLAMRTVACADGRVLAGFSLAAEALDPPVIGSSTAVRPVDNAEMDETARRLVARLGCSGFVSFDFILAEDGSARLIEMNARPIGSGHLGRRFGQDLYGAWLRSFHGFRDVDPPEADTPRAVALFPKEMGRDPVSPRLVDPDTLHDVPWDEPRILSHYRERLMRRHPASAAVIERALTAEQEPTAARRARFALTRLTRLWT